MVIHKKIVLYSLLAGLAFAAANSWAGDPSESDIFQLRRSTSLKTNNAGVVMVVGIFSAATYGTYRLIKYVYHKCKNRNQKPTQKHQCGPGCEPREPEDPFELEDRTPFRLEDLSIATANQMPRSDN